MTEDFPRYNLFAETLLRGLSVLWYVESDNKQLTLITFPKSLSGDALVTLTATFLP